MFKIIDNSDGSTSVFSSDNGQLICTLGSRPGNRPEAVGISHPIVRVQPAVITANCTASLQPQKQEGYLHDLPGHICETLSSVTSQNEEIADDASVITLLSSSSSEDQFQDECIDQSRFLQHLGLYNSTQESDGILKSLKTTFPVRMIARIQDSSPLEENLKDCEDMDICSPLGQMMLNDSNAILNTQAIKLAVKKCEKYCQFSLVSLHPVFSHLTQLRDRDLYKKYPVTFRPLKTWGVDRVHRYSFNSWQRQENLKILKTGLNKKSRKMKRSCKTLSVVLKRLTKRELKQWKSRRKTFAPHKLNTTYDKTNSSLTEPRVMKNTSDLPKIALPECWVSLENLEKKFIVIGNKIYLKDTNIIVNNTQCLRNFSEVDRKYNVSKSSNSSYENSHSSQLFSSQNRKDDSQKSHSHNSNRIQKNTYSSHIAQSGGAFNNLYNSSNKGVSHSKANVLSSGQSYFKPVRWTISSKSGESEPKEGIVKPITLKALHSDYNLNNLSSLVNKKVHNYSSLPSLSNSGKIVITIDTTHSPQVHIQKSQPSAIDYPNKIYSATRHSTVLNALSSVFADHGSYTSSLYGDSETSQLSVSKENVTTCVQVAPFSRRPTVLEASHHNQWHGKLDLKDNLPENCEQNPSSNSHIHNQGAVLNCAFLCFGCGLKVMYNSKPQAMYHVNNHLTSFHSVRQPQSFLKNYYSDKDRLVIIEAFPGYKSNKC